MLNPDWYNRTTTTLNLMLNTTPAAPGVLQWFQQFGTHGYSFCIAEVHIEYLRDVNSAIAPESAVFNFEMIQRWRTLNSLLITYYRPDVPVPKDLQGELPGLAALLSFPLLEEIARRVSNSWDENGLLNVAVPVELGLSRIDSKGNRQAKTFKKGDKIVDLSHKLLVMKATLSEDFQQGIESLDRRLRVSNIEGVSMPHVTLFERLEYFRNMWLHGRRFIGIEAWLVTFFLAMLHFRLPRPRA